MNSNMYLFSTEIPEITDSTEDLSVNEADSFLLTCNHTGVPSPVVTWYKDTLLLSSDNPAKLLIQSNELSVFSVTTNDEGVYECRVTNVAGSESALISVDVIREFIGVLNIGSGASYTNKYTYSTCTCVYVHELF